MRRGRWRGERRWVDSMRQGRRRRAPTCDPLHDVETKEPLQPLYYTRAALRLHSRFDTLEIECSTGFARLAGKTFRHRKLSVRIAPKGRVSTRRPRSSRASRCRAAGRRSSTPRRRLRLRMPGSLKLRRAVRRSGNRRLLLRMRGNPRRHLRLRRRRCNPLRRLLLRQVRLRRGMRSNRLMGRRLRWRGISRRLVRDCRRG